MNKISGVYQIRNVVNNKRYIGSSIDVNGRWGGHQRELKENRHHSVHLQRAWNKYGKDNFAFEVVEHVSQRNLTKKEFREPLLAREQHYKDLHKSYDRKYGYDICQVAGSTLGVPISENCKRAVSIANKGNKYALGHKVSRESGRKMSAGRNDRKLEICQLTEIKKLYRTKNYSIRKIAIKYGVSYLTIWRVLNNKIYPHRKWLEKRGKQNHNQIYFGF